MNVHLDVPLRRTSESIYNQSSDLLQWQIASLSVRYEFGCVWVSVIWVVD